MLWEHSTGEGYQGSRRERPALPPANTLHHARPVSEPKDTKKAAKNTRFLECFPCSGQKVKACMSTYAVSRAVFTSCIVHEQAPKSARVECSSQYWGRSRNKHADLGPFPLGLTVQRLDLQVFPLG
jgi:hypothetical protein